jgi:hypothetical protein
MTTRVGRTVRLSALALATGTVVVAATTGANASTSASTSVSYAGTTGSSNVSLNLTLPLTSDLAPTLGTFFTTAGLTNPFGSDGTISLSLLNETGALQHDATGAISPIATSTGAVAGGTLGSLITSLQADLPIAINQTVTASLANPGTHTSSQALGEVTNELPATVQGLIGLSLPGVSESTVRSPQVTSGTSSIANVDLAKIADALPAGTLAPLESALSTVLTEETSLFGTATGDLGPALQAQVKMLPSPLNTELSTAIADGTTLATELNSEIPAALTALEDGSVVSLDGLTTTHSTTTSGTTEISTVTNKLAGLSILGGLVKLDGFSNSLTTEAGGTAGTAKVIAQPNLVTASAGTSNELSAAVGQAVVLEGTIADLLNAATGDLASTVLGELSTGLKTLTSTLNSTLAVAGIQIEPDAVLKNVVAKDGTAAQAALSGLQIIVNPLAGLPTSTSLARTSTAKAAAATTPPLLDINIGALSATSAAGVVTPTTTTTTATPTTPVKRLAFTGADLPLTAGIASLLVIGGAYTARRRRNGHAGDDI